MRFCFGLCWYARIPYVGGAQPPGVWTAKPRVTLTLRRPDRTLGLRTWTGPGEAQDLGVLGLMTVRLHGVGSPAGSCTALGGGGGASNDSSPHAPAMHDTLPWVP